MEAWVEQLERITAEMADLRVRRDDVIIGAAAARVPVTRIAHAAGVAATQIHRVINEKAPSLRLGGPGPDGNWADSVGKVRNRKPTWLVATEGSGSVRGWYFDREDAEGARVEGQYFREVDHDVLHFDWI